MTIRNLEQTIIQKVEHARDVTEAKLYKEFKNSKSVDEREQVYAKLSVLRTLTSTLINNIRGNKDDG